MALKQLARESWPTFFDAVSKSAQVRTARVELTGLNLGHRLAADHAVLIGITYEPKPDTLTLMLEGLEHRIERPTAIHVEQDGTEVRSIEVVDAEGVHHIAQFHAALELAGE